MYIWQHKDWPNFKWDENRIAPELSEAEAMQARLVARMEALGFGQEQSLTSITDSITTSSEIEGIKLNSEEVRSSVAWQMGLPEGGVPSADRYVEGVVEVMLEALNNYNDEVSEERLHKWHQLLFPEGHRWRMSTIGGWRESEAPMQVVSGRYGKERIHFEAPPSSQVPTMMQQLLKYINSYTGNAIVLSAVSHLWFVTIHPYSDGNGRIGRTLSEMLLMRGAGSPIHLCSMSAEMAAQRKAYYSCLEEAQHGSLDITSWLVWYIGCYKQALTLSNHTIDHTIQKADFWRQYRHVPLNQRQQAMVNMLWDGFNGHLTTSKWAKINKCSQDTALRDLRDLVDKGLLRLGEGGGRSTHYILNIAQ